MAYLGNRPATGENNAFRILDDISSHVVSFNGSSASVVSVSADTITIAGSEHRYITGQRVTYSKGGGTVITGLTDATAYYVIKDSDTTIQLATTASNANNGVAVNLTGLGAGTAHTLTLAFDGTNTKFKPTYNDGSQNPIITRAAQLVLSLNGVIQQPIDSASPSAGFGIDVSGNIIFSTAPDANDDFWGHVHASNTVTFDISDNDIDNFTGDGSTANFNLSKTPPDNRNILVTLDGVIQYPSDNSNTRAYTLSENELQFVSAPASGVAIQVRHIGFAGASGGSGGVSGFYGRTGNVVLKSTDNPVIGNLTAVDGTFSGNVSIAKTLTYMDVAHIDAVGVITAQSGINLAGGNITLLDRPDGNSQNLFFGTGAKAAAYHDGTNFTVINNTGHTYIGIGAANKDLMLYAQSTGNIILQRNTGHKYFEGVGSDGTAKIYHNTNEKIRTTPTGAVVTGILTATTDINVGENIKHIGDPDTKITFPSAGNQIQFDTGGTNYLKLHNYASVNFIEVGAAADVSFADSGSDTRYVLIGDASASSTGAITMQAGAGSQGMGGGLTLYSHANTTNAGGVYIGKSQGSSGSIIFGNGGLSPVNEYARINSNGDLGIGNTSPNCRLAVKDVAEHTAYANVTPSVGDCMLQLYNNPPNETANDHATIQFGVNGGSHNRVNTISAVAESAGNRKMATTFCTDSGSNRNERMRITGDGNVLVGTTDTTLYNNTQSSGTGIMLRGGHAIDIARSADLQLTLNRLTNEGANIALYQAGGLKGTIGTKSGAIYFGTDGDTERLRITAAGKVGIGITNPTAKFEVHNLSNIEVLRIKDTHFNKYLTIRGGGSPNRMVIDSYEGGGGGADIDLASNGSTKVRITSTGNVLIGNFTPVDTRNTGGIHIQDNRGISFKAHSSASSRNWRIRNDDSAWGNLDFGVGTSNSDFADVAAETVLSLASSRRVGINEVSPDAPLHITGGLPSILLENSGTSASAGDILGKIEFKHNDSTDPGVTAAIKCIAEDDSGNSYLTFNNGDGGNATERLRIASTGQVGINQTPDAAGGLVQIRYNEGYQSGTTNLLTSASKAALRIRTSSDSSKSLYFGGIDESATPYLQVGNRGTDGATAVYPLALQPYSHGEVIIGGDGTIPSGNGTSMTEFGSNTGGLTIDDVGVNHTGLRLSHGSDDTYLVQANNNNFYISSYLSGSMIFGVGSSGTERLRIASNGQIKFATSNSTTDNLLWGSNPRLWLKCPDGINGLRIDANTTPLEIRNSAGNGRSIGVGGGANFDMSFSGDYSLSANGYDSSPRIFLNATRHNGSSTVTSFQTSIQAVATSNTNNTGYLGLGGSAAPDDLVIDTGGRIGLGITNPSAYFSSYNRVVMGRTNDTGGMTIVSANNSSGYIAFADGTSGNEAYRGRIIYAHGGSPGDYMSFHTDATEKLRITSEGWTEHGKRYSGSSTIDTGIYVGNANNYGHAVFEVIVAGNPNHWGSGQYSACSTYILSFGVGWTGSATSTRFRADRISYGDGGSSNTSEVTATFHLWDATTSTETSSGTSVNGNNQLRIKIAGSSTAAYCRCYIKLKAGTTYLS